MKNIVYKGFIIAILLVSATVFGACNIFKVNITPPNNTTTYNIVVYAIQGGTVTGGGVYQKDATVTLTATAQEGYTFVNWTSGGVSVNSGSTYTFTATQNIVLYANFISVARNYTVTANNELNAAHISGLGTYDENQTVTLSVLSRTNFTFAGWKINGQVVSIENSYTFIITQNVEVQLLWQYNGGGGIEPV